MPVTARLICALEHAFERVLTQHRSRHGIKLSLYIEAAPLNKIHLWQKLETALDLIATHYPIWIERIIKMNASINVRRIPGTRAQLSAGRFIILDPYLLNDFAPAQIASSIVHEATHARVFAAGIRYDPLAPAKEERICRRAELRFGQALQRVGVPDVEGVIARAATTIRAPDAQAGVVVDRRDLRAIQLVTRIKDLPVPRWLKKRIAGSLDVLDTPQGRAAFAASPNPETPSLRKEGSARHSPPQ